MYKSSEFLKKKKKKPYGNQFSSICWRAENREVQDAWSKESTSSTVDPCWPPLATCHNRIRWCEEKSGHRRARFELQGSVQAGDFVVLAVRSRPVGSECQSMSYICGSYGTGPNNLTIDIDAPSLASCRLWAHHVWIAWVHTTDHLLSRIESRTTSIIWS